MLLKTVANKSLFNYFGASRTHDHLNVIAGFDEKSFDRSNKEIRMLPEDFEKAGYDKTAPYSKIYTNYSDIVTRDHTYLRCKGIYLLGAAEGKGPLTLEDAAFTNEPPAADGRLTTLARTETDAKGFVSVHNVRTRKNAQERARTRKNAQERPTQSLPTISASGALTAAAGHIR